MRIPRSSPCTRYRCRGGVTGCWHGPQTRSARKTHLCTYTPLTCTCKHRHAMHMHDRTDAHTHAQIHTHTHTHKYTRTHTNTHAHTHTHTHTHTHAAATKHGQRDQPLCVCCAPKHGHKTPHDGRQPTADVRQHGCSWRHGRDGASNSRCVYMCVYFAFRAVQ